MKRRSNMPLHNNCCESKIKTGKGNLAHYSLCLVIELYLHCTELSSSVPHSGVLVALLPSFKLLLLHGGAAAELSWAHC